MARQTVRPCARLSGAGAEVGVEVEVEVKVGVVAEAGAGQTRGVHLELRSSTFMFIKGAVKYIHVSN